MVRTPGVVARLPPPRAEPPRLRVLAAVWLAGWELARRFPEPLAFGAADLAGRAVARWSRRTRAVLTRNFRRVLGPDADPGALERTVRDACRSYARYWVEAFRAADLNPDDLAARTSTDGFEHLDAALEQGRGVVVLLAHHGSWDVAARWAETHGYHLAVVAEVVRPRRVFARFVTLREAMGLDVVPLRRGWARGDRGDGVLGDLERTMAANHLVGLLADRDLSGGAPVAPLFGEPAGVPRGPTVLAQRTGAPIVPITMLQRPGRRWHLQVLPPVDVTGLDARAAARRIAGAVEDLVRLEPAQWHCFSPVWLADRGRRR